jgi:alanyl-tRNA synthetase
MLASEIRTRFLQYFARNGHVIRPSSSLVPEDDPTLLFVNAGMVLSRRSSWGWEPPDGKRRATTSQHRPRRRQAQRSRAGRPHGAPLTFFEMLGNFSFGDYFGATPFVSLAVLTRSWPRPVAAAVTVLIRTARALWREIASFPDSPDLFLGDKDNFWQMADTSPCGP